VLYGAAKSRTPADALAKLRELTSLMPALALPETAAENYGRVRAQLESKGALIGNNDLWIASHALASNLILVTNNEKEFVRVAGLKIENWSR
jgi:tRNA(fMet)-specific endonuclease VapC